MAQDLTSKVTQIITRYYVVPKAYYRHCILIKTVHFVMSLKAVAVTKCSVGSGFLCDKFAVLRPTTKGTPCRRHTSPVSLSTRKVYCNIICH